MQIKEGKDEMAVCVKMCCGQKRYGSLVEVGVIELLVQSEERKKSSEFIEPPPYKASAILDNSPLAQTPMKVVLFLLCLGDCSSFFLPFPATSPGWASTSLHSFSSGSCFRTS